LNSPKRPPYWNSTSDFDFDHRGRKRMMSCRFSRWGICAIYLRDI